MVIKTIKPLISIVNLHFFGFNQHMPLRISHSPIDKSLFIKQLGCL